MWKVIIWPNNILPSWKLLKTYWEFFFFFPLLIRIIKFNVFLYTHYFWLKKIRKQYILGILSHTIQNSNDVTIWDFFFFFPHLHLFIFLLYIFNMVPNSGSLFFNICCYFHCQNQNPHLRYRSMEIPSIPTPLIYIWIF